MSTATYAEVESVSPGHWWIPLIQGISLIIIGILLFTNTAATLATIMIFLGVYWMIGGIFALVSLFMSRENWIWKLFSGIIGILAGIVLVQHPLWASVLLPATLAWVLGIFGVVIGIFEIIQAFRGGGWGSGILGVVSIIFGLIILGGGNALLTGFALVLVAAAWAIVAGIAEIIFAFRLRSS